VAKLPREIAALLEQQGPARAVGPFVLVRQLGTGGFAPVWLAKEMYGGTELRAAAVKLFALSRAGSAGASDHRRRIIDEARALCRVEHPNIVRFYALPTDHERGVIGLAMELVDGPPLTAAIQQHGKLSVEAAVAVGVSVASALAAIHRSGLVHRDVKPGNVIEQRGTFKLIDFGIAAAEHAVAPVHEERPRRPRTMVLDDLPLEIAHTKAATLGERLTRDGGTSSNDALKSLTGTLGYIDPERIQSPEQPATSASDLYGLGAMLYECLGGMLPAVAAARADGSSGLKGEVLDGRARAPSMGSLEPGLPVALAHLVDSLVEPKAADRPASAEAVATELERIRGELSGHKRVLPPEDTGPFRAFARFEEGDRDVFFGRRSEVAGILETLRSRGVVALVGSTGAGKSSLARAGVVPAIRDGELVGWPKHWDVAVLTPGSAPDDSLALALRSHMGEVVPNDEEPLWDALITRVQTTGRGLLIVVDQLEEIATLGGGRDTLLARLVARIGEHPVPGVRALVTMRQDMLKDVLAIPRLGKIVVGGATLVAPLGESAWAEVLDHATAAYGYTYDEPRLREDILRDLRGTSSAMPLVQFALSRLWEKRDRQKRQVTMLAYLAMGGINGALEKYADKTVERIASGAPEARLVVERVLLSLTTASGTRAVRRLDALEPRERRTVDALIQSRLVVHDGSGVTLAHDSLVAHWMLLRGLVAAAREDRVRAEELERAAGKWLGDPDPGVLWRRRQLAVAEDLAKRGHVALSDGATIFLRASRRAERSGAFVLVGTAVVMLALGGAGGLYELSRARAMRDDALRDLGNAKSSESEAKVERDTERNLSEARARKLVEAEESTQSALAEVTRLQGAIDAGTYCPHLSVTPPTAKTAPPSGPPCPQADPLCYLRAN
jgi:eukaryotic-like serine/threonine-protein kinase